MRYLRVLHPAGRYSLCPKEGLEVKLGAFIGANLRWSLPSLYLLVPYVGSCVETPVVAVGKQAGCCGRRPSQVLYSFSSEKHG
jgi:hypothetical protein